MLLEFSNPHFDLRWSRGSCCEVRGRESEVVVSRVGVVGFRAAVVKR